jgi:hypothetical protein
MDNQGGPKARLEAVVKIQHTHPANNGREFITLILLPLRLFFKPVPKR